MRKRKKPDRKRRKTLDTNLAAMPAHRLPGEFGEVRGRGRPPKMPASEIIGRAGNYRPMFWSFRLRTNKKDPSKNCWVRDKRQPWAEQLLRAKSAADVERALAAGPQERELKPLAGLILKVFNEKSFPKKVEKQLDFLADSLAGLGWVSPRRARDICAQERARRVRESRHQILRHEYYVECSCGYKGPARDNACRKCGAKILSVPVGFAGF